MKRVSLLMFALAIGCGGGKEPAPTPENKPDQTKAAPTAPTAPAVGKPSNEEAVASIQEHFTDPGSGVGFLKVDVEQLSSPVEAPKEIVPGQVEAWAYSVTMNCESILGDKIQNRNWVVLIGRENGKAKVKDFHLNLERVANTPLGKDWWAKAGLPDPVMKVAVPEPVIME